MPYRKPNIVPPWGGWNDGVPSIVSNATSFQQITNWLIRFGRLGSMAKNSKWQYSDSLLTNNKLPIAVRTYADSQGYYHTVGIDDKGPQEFIPGFGFTNSTWGAGFPSYTDVNLFSMEVYINQLFFCNGYTPLMMHKGDGHFYAMGPTAPVIPGLGPIGNFPGSCYFLGKLAGRLLAINTVEPLQSIAGATNYTSRIRYCALNNAAEWLATNDPTAGVFTLSEVEDQLTGWMTANQTGFAFRQNGITAISATGNLLIPFYEENFSVGPRGVGNYIPYSLSSYGNIGCFVGEPDIYMFTGGAPNPIGGTAKRSIFNDLASNSSTVFGQMVGSLGQFVDYLTYWLCIPQNNDTTTSVWVYHFDDQSWINLQLPYGALRCIGNLAVV